MQNLTLYKNKHHIRIPVPVPMVDYSYIESLLYFIPRGTSQRYNDPSSVMSVWDRKRFICKNNTAAVSRAAAFGPHVYI